MPTADISSDQNAAVEEYLKSIFEGHGVRSKPADFVLGAHDFYIDEPPPGWEHFLYCVRLDGQLLDDSTPEQLVQRLRDDDLAVKLPERGKRCCRHFTLDGAVWDEIHPEPRT
jgi:hypothetical protein